MPVLKGTGSVGASLLLWSFGAVVSTCGLLVWLELGLSVPFRDVRVTPGPHGTIEKKSVPQNGGEKNYVSQHDIYLRRLLMARLSFNFYIQIRTEKDQDFW